MQLKFSWTFISFFKKFNYYPPSTNLSYFKYSTIFGYKYLLNLLAIPSKHIKLLHIIPKLMFSLSYVFNHLTPLQVPYRSNNLPSPVFRFNSITNLLSSISNFNYLFSFYCERLNKRLYKFSNYKRPRFSLKHVYIPKYRRFKHALSVLIKTFSYLKGITFRARFSSNWVLFSLDPQETFFVKYIYLLQHRVFRNKTNKFFRKR